MIAIPAVLLDIAMTCLRKKEIGEVVIYALWSVEIAILIFDVLTVLLFLFIAFYRLAKRLWANV